ncbi:MAG: 2-keto-4-pentenoate hydratase [Acidimicrobiales bacterium]
MSGPGKGVTAVSRESVATELLEAEAKATALGPITAGWPEMDLADATAVQALTLAERERRGERLTGLKLGLTSRAKQVRMGIATPITAWLTDAMSLPLSEPVDVDRLIHPRAEPEIVFVMGDSLRGPGVTAAEALSAVASVRGGIEIIDSRFKDFKFTLEDVIADNASSALYVLGPVALSPQGLDLSLEACLVEVDGKVEDSATGAAVQGHPAEALAQAANALSRDGLFIKAGWTVLTGGMTDAVALSAGTTMRVEFTSLGSIVLSATGGDSTRKARDQVGARS